MSNDQDHIDELESANAQLSESLKNCRELVSEFRAQLAANQNDPGSEEFARDQQMAVHRSNEPS